MKKCTHAKLIKYSLQALRYGIAPHPLPRRTYPSEQTEGANKVNKMGFEGGVGCPFLTFANAPLHNNEACEV